MIFFFLFKFPRITEQPTEDGFEIDGEQHGGSRVRKIPHHGMMTFGNQTVLDRFFTLG